jgi:hypothetical protein
MVPEAITYCIWMPYCTLSCHKASTMSYPTTKLQNDLMFVQYHIIHTVFFVRECTALPRVEFLSNPRRIHSEEEEEEKEEQGLPRALVCCSTTSPSPSPFPPPTHTARLLNCLGLRYQDTSPLPKYILMGQNQWLSGKAAKKYDSLFLET